MCARRVLYFIFSAGDIIITIFIFSLQYTRRAVKPFRYATNVTLLRCACMCTTPPPLPVARVTLPPPNHHRIRAYTHTYTIPSRLVRILSPLYTYTIPTPRRKFSKLAWNGDGGTGLSLKTSRAFTNISK